MITNDQMTLDAKVRFTPFQDQDVSAADSANKLPLFCDTVHDIYAIGIESVVTKAGDTNGADVVINIGSIADPDLIGTVTADKAATPAINAAVAGTINSTTKETIQEAHGGVLVPKGTPIYATYTASASNVAQRAVRFSYVLADEVTYD